jgi:metal-responsive CopG/Arc/MetJ family transcriptional regulator
MKKTESLVPKRKQLRKLSFAADEALAKQIDAVARATKVGRSFVIREVLSGWLAERRLETSRRREVEP